MTDQEIESLPGLTWTGDYWKIEDADLHPLIRTIVSMVKQEQAEPVGIVVEHRTGGMCFYQWGQPPYLDNAIKHWVVYTAPKGQTELLKQALSALHCSELDDERYAAITAIEEYLK